MCSHCERAYRQCVPGQAGCTQSAGLGQSGCTAGTHAVLLGTWDTGQAHRSIMGEVCRSRRSGRPFDLEAFRADAFPTIPRAFLLSPFRNRGIRAGHIFCPSCRLPSRLVLVYSKAAMCFTLIREKGEATFSQTIWSGDRWLLRRCSAICESVETQPDCDP